LVEARHWFTIKTELEVTQKLDLEHGHVGSLQHGIEIPYTLRAVKSR
jgi:hypothetical protein